MTGEANLLLVPDEDFELARRRELLAAQAYPDLIRDIQAERRVRNDLVAELRARKEERRRRRVNLVLQLAIALLSMSALYLITAPGPYFRWGYVLGLASQPLYIAATWRARQWGMLAVAIATCGLWARGIALHF